MNPYYPNVARCAGHRCEYCHAPEVIFNFLFEVEHIAPTAQGGEDSLDNLALACRSCNAFKSARRMGPDSETGEVVSLFHPRHEIWEEHFAIEASTEKIVGKTAIGRATVATLKLNTSAQLLARQQWRRLDLFP